MIHAATATHGVLLQQPQAGGGLAGVRQTHAGTGQLRHQRSGGGGDPGEPHRQVEGGALPRHQGGGLALEVEQALAGEHRLPIGHQQAHRHRRI